MNVKVECSPGCLSRGLFMSLTRHTHVSGWATNDSILSGKLLYN